MWICLLTLPRASWYAGPSFPPSCLYSRRLPAQGRGSRQGPPDLACSSIHLGLKSPTPDAVRDRAERTGPCERPWLVSVWPGHDTAPLLSRITGGDKGLWRRPGTHALSLDNRYPSGGSGTPAFVVSASRWGVGSTRKPQHTQNQCAHTARGCRCGAPGSPRLRSCALRPSCPSSALAATGGARILPTRPGPSLAGRSLWDMRRPPAGLGQAPRARGAVGTWRKGFRERAS